MVDHEGSDIGVGGLVGQGKPGPFGVVHFPFDGADGGETGGAQEVEGQKSIGGDHRKVGGKGVPELGAVFGRFRVTVEDPHGAHHVFFGHKARDGGHRGVPGTETQGGEDPGDGPAQGREEPLVEVLHHAKAFAGKTEARKEPDNHRRDEDHRTGLSDKGPGPLPHAPQDIGNRGEVIGGKLHHKGGGIPGEDLCFFQDDPRQDHRKDP